MIDIEQGLREFLITNVTLAEGHVYGAPLPTGSLMPAITYQRLMGGKRDRSHSGATGLVASRFQVDAWGTDWTKVRALSNQICQKLDGVKGSWGNSDTVTVGNVIMDDPFDAYAEEVPLQHIVHTMTIWHLEATA